MGESSPSHDSDGTIEDLDKIADVGAINMHAFELIIEACRKDPKIVSSVGESLNCSIRDINARENFTIKHDTGGKLDAAHIEVSATSKS